MTAAAIMNECQQSGVTLSMDARGGLFCRGDQAAVSRLLPKIREHKPALLRMLAGKSDPTITDLDTLAASIAAEFRVRPAAVMGLLDDDDREAIRTGSDPGRADAWRFAVASLVHRGEWKPAPEQVTCSDCRHAQMAAPGMIDCAAKVRAPGACGPFRWWATDRHICDAWEARP